MHNLTQSLHKKQIWDPVASFVCVTRLQPIQRLSGSVHAYNIHYFNFKGNFKVKVKYLTKSSKSTQSDRPIGCAPVALPSRCRRLFDRASRFQWLSINI